MDEFWGLVYSENIQLIVSLTDFSNKIPKPKQNLFQNDFEIRLASEVTESEIDLSV